MNNNAHPKECITLPAFRRGNDIYLVWKVLNDDGEPYILDGRNMTLYLRTAKNQNAIYDQLSINGNTVSCIFRGKNQSILGKYHLVLVENEGQDNMHSLDIDAVELVARTAEEKNGSGNLHVETHTVNLLSVISPIEDAVIPETIARVSWVNRVLADNCPFEPGEGTKSAQQKSVDSFLYHAGKADERTIEVEQPSATGDAAVAIGIGTEASGQGAYAEGSIAVTDDSHWAQTGEQTLINTEAKGRGSHAEGLGTKSNGSGTHSEGIGTIVDGNSGHAEGYYTHIEKGEGAHTEGMMTSANGNATHAEGYNTYAKGTAAHAEGRSGNALGYGSHVEGGYHQEKNATLYLTYYTFEDEGVYKVESGTPIIGSACGKAVIQSIQFISGEYVPDGWYLSLSDDLPGDEIVNQKFIFSNVANGTSSHSEGENTSAMGIGAHAEGSHTHALGDYSHAEGLIEPVAEKRAEYSYSFDIQSAKTESRLYQITNGPAAADAVSKGWKLALINGEDVSDRNITITSVYSGGSKWFQLSEKVGIGNKTDAVFKFIKQEYEISYFPDDKGAKGTASHTEGIGTTTLNDAEHAEGAYNKSNTGEEPELRTRHSIGIGSDGNEKNAVEVMENGDAYFYGVGGYNGTNPSSSDTIKKVIDSKLAINDSPFEKGQGTNSAQQRGGNLTIFGENSVAFGTSTTSAIDRGITEESTPNEIVNEWRDSNPDSDKFSLVKGSAAHAEGTNGLALGDHSHVEGNGCIAYDNSAHAEGTGCEASGKYSHSEGLEAKAEGKQSHSEGKSTRATASSSHAEGQSTIANKSATHAEGINTLAGSGDRPDADSDTTSGKFSHAEGNGTQASGNSSHSEGKHTLASGDYSHAEGLNSVASGPTSHVEGEDNESNADCSHVEGYQNIAEGDAGCSHVEGKGNTTTNKYEHAEGCWNKSHRASSSYGNGGNTIHSVGIGTNKTSGRKNAFEIMQNGDAYVIGIGGYDGTNAAQPGIKTLQTVLSELGA